MMRVYLTATALNTFIYTLCIYDLLFLNSEISREIANLLIVELRCPPARDVLFKEA
jgi:hypothetical protein